MTHGALRSPTLKPDRHAEPITGWKSSSGLKVPAHSSSVLGQLPKLSCYPIRETAHRTTDRRTMKPIRLEIGDGAGFSFTDVEKTPAPSPISKRMGFIVLRSVVLWAVSLIG